jgi:hypothetical protein
MPWRLYHLPGRTPILQKTIIVRKIMATQCTTRAGCRLPISGSANSTLSIISCPYFHEEFLFRRAFWDFLLYVLNFMIRLRVCEMESTPYANHTQITPLNPL